MKRFMQLVLGVACVLIWAAPIVAQDDKSPGGGEGDEMAAMMAEMMKYADPGENHEHLKSLAGTWNLSSKFRMAPDAPWDTSGGESVNEWILGGRFLQQKVKSPPSEKMLFAFEGFGLLGYDNFAKKYVSLWMDSFFTGVMHFQGFCDASGKVITFEGEIANPMKGGAMTKSRWVYKIINDNKFIFEMWEPDDAGKQYLHGEITYSRVK